MVIMIIIIVDRFSIHNVRIQYHRSRTHQAQPNLCIPHNHPQHPAQHRNSFTSQYSEIDDTPKKVHALNSIIAKQYATLKVNLEAQEHIIKLMRRLKIPARRQGHEEHPTPQAPSTFGSSRPVAPTTTLLRRTLS
jgi:hypothetical protein